MCLGVPGQIVELFQEGVTLMGTVDFIGIRRKVCFASLPDVAVGDYVLVHVGFGLARLDEENAIRTIALMRELGVLEEELGPEAQAASTS